MYSCLTISVSIAPPIPEPAMAMPVASPRLFKNHWDGSAIYSGIEIPCEIPNRTPCRINRWYNLVANADPKRQRKARKQLSAISFYHDLVLLIALRIVSIDTLYPLSKA